MQYCVAIVSDLADTGGIFHRCTYRSAGQSIQYWLAIASDWADTDWNSVGVLAGLPDTQCNIGWQLYRIRCTLTEHSVGVIVGGSACSAGVCMLSTTWLIMYYISWTLLSQSDPTKPGAAWCALPMRVIWHYIVYTCIFHSVHSIVLYYLVSILMPWDFSFV